MIQKKRVVVVHWKKHPENPFEVFSSLKNFCLSYSRYNYNTLSNYLSKGKIAYENPDIRIERKNVILKPKPDAGLFKQRAILPVLRKVKIKEAEDAKHDLKFWLNRTHLERMVAVTVMASQSLTRPERMDKSKVVKRKLKS